MPRRPPPSPEVQAMLDLTRSLVAVATRSVEAGSEVTLPQFRALYVLERIGPCNAGGLAGQLGLHASTVTRLCDRLVALDYVTRDVKPDNRREVQLEITASGRRIVRTVLRRRAAELERILAALPEGGRAQLAQILPQLVAAAEQSHGDRPETH